MKLGPRLSRSNQRRWENDCVERDIILTHELVKLNVLLVLPPLFPLVSVASCDGDVTNWRVKPNVENLVLKFLNWDSSSPFEITSDAATEETLLKHRVSEAN